MNYLTVCYCFHCLQTFYERLRDLTQISIKDKLSDPTPTNVRLSKLETTYLLSLISRELPEAESVEITTFRPTKLKKILKEWLLYGGLQIRSFRIIWCEWKFFWSSRKALLLITIFATHFHFLLLSFFKREEKRGKEQPKSWSKVMPFNSIVFLS